MEYCDTLRRLQEVEFGLVELQFYLDINPGDRRAIAQYNCLSEELMRLKQQYEMKYGPLMQFGFSQSPAHVFAWATTPWPWEIEY